MPTIMLQTPTLPVMPQADKSSPVNITKIGNLDHEAESILRDKICSIFEEVQRSDATHRKSIVALRKIQEKCYYESPAPQPDGGDLVLNEESFNTEIQRCILRVLTIKKSEPTGNRVVKFLSMFLRQSIESDNAIYQLKAENDCHLLLQTHTNRLITLILSIPLQLLFSKDKVIRFRSTQIISSLVNTIDSIDDEYYVKIKYGLMKCLKDKESNVRVQAVCGLGRLASETKLEDTDDEVGDNIGGSILEKLLDMLQNDPSPEVRRALLLNLPFSSESLPFLLERARDADSSIRRVIYSRLLPALGDFRHLSLVHREKLLRWGLRDRDELVKKAAARLFQERWISDCSVSKQEVGQPQDLSPGKMIAPSLEGLSELLERIDVLNAGVDNGVALDAMRAFWTGRPDYFEFMVFDDTFWKSLTPESVFIARTFNDHHRQKQLFSDSEDKMPEVTKLAFLLQKNINMLTGSIRLEAFELLKDDESIQQEFIVEQLLNIALTLDYADEIGRRTMFSLMREALSLADLPEHCTSLVVQVLRAACGTTIEAEQEFSAVVLEAIGEVHDTILSQQSLEADEAEESFHSACSQLARNTIPSKICLTQDEDEEQVLREIVVNLQCLYIAQCMLQNVMYGLEKNPHLVTMLNNLIVPAVRSQEAPIRERGLICLGLSCLLDQNLAAENITLFVHCFNKGHEALQTIAIQTISDIVAAHPHFVFNPDSVSVASDGSTDGNDSLRRRITRLFLKGLKSSFTDIQSVSCIAICKLMLSASLSSQDVQHTLEMDDLLKSLVIKYFDPQTSANIALRQALSYFLPVYCHSKEDNMQRMSRISVQILDWFMRIKEELVTEGEDVNTDMISTATVMAHLVDWTDSHKLAATTQFKAFPETCSLVHCDAHLNIALELLERLQGSCSKNERKQYVSMLGKLQISSDPRSEKLRSIKTLSTASIKQTTLDVTARNILNKTIATVDKILFCNIQNPSESTSYTTSSLTRGDSEVMSSLDNNELNKETSDMLFHGKFSNVVQGADESIQSYAIHRTTSRAEAEQSTLVRGSATSTLGALS